MKTNKSADGIIGFAIGDALGVPVEFKSRQELEQNSVTDMVGYGTHNMPQGAWSDDTAMTLATMKSIIEKHGIDTNDMADKFIDWFRNSEYTANGRVFDIGRTTLQALAKYELKIDDAVNCGGNGEYDNGNGSLMRMLPIAYYCWSKKLNTDGIIKVVRDVSSITHRHEISILGCYIYVRYVLELLNGSNKEVAYQRIKNMNYNFFDNSNIERYNRIIRNSINDYNIEEIKSTGYIVDTLEAVLWVFLNSNDYNTTVLKVVNLGEDTDTIAACAGGLAGLYYGIDNIKQEWKNNLLRYDYIIDLCNKFDKKLKLIA